MPLKGEAKREYQRRYMRKRRTTYQGGDRDSKGKGVRPTDTMLDPPREREDVRPIPMNPRTMSKRKLVEYLAHVGRLGFSLAETSRGYELVANTGSLVPFDGVAVLEGTLAAHGKRIMALEADLARLEVMIDSMLREGELA